MYKTHVWIFTLQKDSYQMKHEDTYFRNRNTTNINEFIQFPSALLTFSV